jgi:hypothetical protein
MNFSACLYANDFIFFFVKNKIFNIFLDYFNMI